MTRSARSLARSERSEAGDTLIEILVAVAILGIAATGLLVGLTTTIASSGNHKNLAALDTVLRSFADSARYQLQLQPNTGSTGTGFPQFARCASNYTFVASPIPGSGPPGTQAVAFGSGFTGLASGSVGIGSFSGTAAAPSGSLGSVTAPFTVPDMPAGPHTVTVTYGATSATTSFTVVPFLVSLDPGSATTGSTVLASVKGFPASTTLKVSVGGTAATVASATTDASGDDASLSFVVPAAAPLGSNTVLVSDSTGAYSASATLTVGSAAAGTTTYSAPSAGLSLYSVGLSSIKYWNGTTFTTPCTTSPPTYEDLQQLTVSGSAPGAVDSLSFVISNPDADGSHPVGAPSVTYSGSPNPIVGATLTFNASIAGTAAGGAPTAGTVNWVIQSDSGAAPTCSSTSGPTRIGSTNSSTASCTVSGSGAVAGTYTVTAIYSGDPYYSTNQGTGSALVTVQQTTPSVAVTSTGLSDGTLELSALVSGPANGPTPTEVAGSNWTITGPAGVSSCTTTGGLTAGAVQGTATDSCSIASAPPGDYVVTYSYTGDTNYKPQTSPPTTFHVADFSVSSAVSGSGPLETLTFTATWTKQSTAVVPTGSVSWAISGAASACTSTVPLTPVVASTTTYTAQCAITGTSSSNTYNATATFSGDVLYVPATAKDDGVTG